MNTTNTNPHVLGQRLLVGTTIALCAYWYLFIYDQSIHPALKTLSIALFGDERAAYLRALPRVALMLSFVGIGAVLFWLRPAKPAPGSGLLAWFDYLACWFIPVALLISIRLVYSFYDWPPIDEVLMVARRFTNMLVVPLDLASTNYVCPWPGSVGPDYTLSPFQQLLIYCDTSTKLSALLPYAALFALWRRLNTAQSDRTAIAGGDLTANTAIDHRPAAPKALPPR